MRIVVSSILDSAVLAFLLFVAGTCFGAVSNLDRPIKSLEEIWLGPPTPLSILLGKDKRLTRDTPIRFVVTESFYQSHFKDAHPARYDQDESVLRESLARLGLTLNMSDSEIALLESNPDHPLFTKIRNVSFEGYQKYRTSIVNSLESSMILFVLDYQKAISKTGPSRLYVPNMGKIKMEVVARVFRSHLGRTFPAIDLNQLVLSPSTRGRLAGHNLTGIVLESQLKASSLTIAELMEIGLAAAVVADPSPYSARFHEACATLLSEIKEKDQLQSSTSEGNAET